MFRGGQVTSGVNENNVKEWEYDLIIFSRGHQAIISLPRVIFTNTGCRLSSSEIIIFKFIFIKLVWTVVKTNNTNSFINHTNDQPGKRFALWLFVTWELLKLHLSSSWGWIKRSVNQSSYRKRESQQVSQQPSPSGFLRCKSGFPGNQNIFTMFDIWYFEIFCHFQGWETHLCSAFHIFCCLFFLLKHNILMIQVFWLHCFWTLTPAYSQ